MKGSLLTVQGANVTDMFASSQWEELGATTEKYVLYSWFYTTKFDKI